MVIPAKAASAGYAQEVRKTLRDARLFVDVDVADNKIQKKVREAQLAQYNHILVSGHELIQTFAYVSQDDLFMSTMQTSKCSELYDSSAPGISSSSVKALSTQQLWSCYCEKLAGECKMGFDFALLYAAGGGDRRRRRRRQ